MSTPAWQLAPPYWELTPRKTTKPKRKDRVEVYRAMPTSIALLERTAADESVLTMKFALFDKWQEVVDHQGHYLERIRPGAFKKTLRENFSQIRAVLSHGKDPSLGQTVLGKISEIREEADGAIARVSLFDSVPPLLVDGLRAGVYGSSWRGRPIKSDTDFRPPRSAHNPEGIPETTRLEIKLTDIGPTPFAAMQERRRWSETAYRHGRCLRRCPTGTWVRIRLNRPGCSAVNDQHPVVFALPPSRSRHRIPRRPLPRLQPHLLPRAPKTSRLHNRKRTRPPAPETRQTGSARGTHLLALRSAGATR